MTKIINKDLAQVLVDKYDFDRQAAEDFVARMAEVLNDGLRTDKQVKVKGLGTFKVTAVAPRKSVDVNTGEDIIIEGRDKISFTADNSMRDQVNKPFAQFETVVINEGVDFDAIDEKFSHGIPEALIETEEDQEEVSDTVTDDVQTEHATAPQAEPSPVVPERVGPQARPEAPQPESMGSDVPPASALVLSMSQLATLNGSPEPEPTGESARGSEEEPRLDDTNVTAKPEARSTSPETTQSEGATTSVAPLRLSTDMLAILNGDRMEQEDSAAEDAADTAAPVATASEQSKGAAEAKPEATPEPEPAQSPSVEMAAQADYDQLEAIKEHAIQLNERVERQHRIFRGVMIAAAVLIGLCIAGVVYLGIQIEKRNNRIQHLEAQASMSQQRQQAAPAQPSDTVSMAERQMKADSMARAAERAEAARIAKMEAEASARKEAREAQERLAAEQERAEAARRLAAEQQEAAAKAAQAKQQAESTAARQSDYDKDVRVRTGAYRIVGVDRTVTVRSGQTLHSISRTHLGPGMECYMEAVNGGNRQLKAGEKVKIPKLQLKRK